MAKMADDTATIRIQGFERITRLEVQLAQFLANDLPHLQRDIESLKQMFSVRNLLLYSGGVSTLFISLIEIARVFKVLP